MVFHGQSYEQVPIVVDSIPAMINVYVCNHYSLSTYGHVDFGLCDQQNVGNSRFILFETSPYQSVSLTELINTS